MTAINAFWAVVGITLAGCGNVPPPQQSAMESSSENRDPKAANTESEKDRSHTYITCRATFTTFENDHPWFDDSSVGHDDGKAPLASFVLVEPATYANRGIGILFKFAANADTTSPPDQADIGSQFTFQIPADFLSGNHETIDNSIVKHFHKVEP
jgi:hypothetical protein